MLRAENWSSTSIPMNTRRLRGLLGLTLLGTIPWATVGFAVGLVLQLRLIPGISVFLRVPIPGGLPVACALAGAIIGALNGLSFGGLLWATERGKNLDQIRASHFAALAAVATGATLGVVTESLIGAGVGGVLGAIGGAGALWLARRVRQPEGTAAVDTAAH
ncbi:MAG: hypothetical protein ACREBE_00685 [bacterium]